MRKRCLTTVKALYESCLYSSIAHAVANINYPLFAFEQSWHGNNYSFIIDSARGVVTFDFERNIVVGVAREEKSRRLLLYPKMHAISLLDKAPEEYKELALRESLPFLMDVIDGIQMPCATTALWNIGEQIVLCDTFEDFVLNGGDYLQCICAPLPDLREYWIEQYEFTNINIDLVDHIFHLKQSGQTCLNRRKLSYDEIKSEGYDHFINALSEIGITL